MNAIADGISSGEMTKVVSSREVQFTSETSYNVASILANLVDNNPNCFIFGYEKDGRTFVGASPEILVRHRGSEILSYALAGTAPKYGPNAWTKEQLLTDKKNLFEHNIVRDRIVDIMKSITPEVIISIICAPLLLQRIAQNPSWNGQSCSILHRLSVVNREKRR